MTTENDTTQTKKNTNYKQYFKINKLSSDDLNTHRGEIAINLGVKMEQELAPWQKIFDPLKDDFSLPYDVISQKFILGYNLIELIANKANDDENICKKQYISLNDIKKNNYRLKKGTHSIHLEQYMKYDISYPIDPKTKKWTFKMVPTKEFIAYDKSVFSVEDLYGKYNFIKLDKQIDHVKFINNLLQKTNVKIVEEKNLSTSYYAPRRDEIHIASKEEYPNEREYYSELLRHLARCLTKPGRFSEKGTEGFAKDKNDIRFLRDKFRVELTTMQLAIMTKLPYKPTLSKLNTKQISYNFASFPNYLTIVANDSYRLVNKALILGLNLEKQQTQKINKDSFKEKIAKDLSNNKSVNINDKTAITVDNDESKTTTKVAADKDKPKSTVKSSVDNDKPTTTTKVVADKNKSDAKTLKEFLKEHISNTNYSNRKLLNLTLNEKFNELDGKKLIDKKNIINSMIKDINNEQTLTR